MRTINEILVIVRNKYLDFGDRVNAGICFALIDLEGILTYKEIKCFENYLWDWAKKNKKFIYSPNGDHIFNFNQNGGYIWEKNDIISRLKWFECEIGKEKCIGGTDIITLEKETARQLLLLIVNLMDGKRLYYKNQKDALETLKRKLI